MGLCPFPAALGWILELPGLQLAVFPFPGDQKPEMFPSFFLHVVSMTDISKLSHKSQSAVSQQCWTWQLHVGAVPGIIIGAGAGTGAV